MKEFASTTTGTPVTSEGFELRLRFDNRSKILSIDLSGMAFRTAEDVNHAFDQCEDSIDATAQDWWFFLVDYTDCEIDGAVWGIFQRRAAALNLAHSMGTARFGLGSGLRGIIDQSGAAPPFDNDAHTSREDAAEYIAKLPTRRRRKLFSMPNYSIGDFEERVEFLLEDEIMDVDLSGLVFHHAQDVDDFFDFIDDQIRRSGRRWYFLVNYSNVRIETAAWVRFARRGRILNQSQSRGTVRYAAASDTASEIRLRAQSQGFSPNLCDTRRDAMHMISRLRSDTAEPRP